MHAGRGALVQTEAYGPAVVLEEPDVVVVIDHHVQAEPLTAGLVVDQLLTRMHRVVRDCWHCARIIS